MIGRTWWARMARVVALVGIVSLSASAPPAQANWAGDLFGKIAGVLEAAGVDHDQIVMARFTIDHPAEASTVYSHAAAQDYPFFGLVAAAKAARGKSFGKLGTFTEDSCKLPITLIDTVFAGAQDQAAGAVNVENEFAAQYAKAASDDVRRDLNEQLLDAVPILRDVPTICTFAFETDFKIESDLRAKVGDTALKIRDTYNAFHSGDVVSGFGDLVKLGVDKDGACLMIDQGVGGGLIGRTPYLGSLAKGACAGFVGVVIDGAIGLVKGGVGYAEDGVVAVYDVGKAGVCAVMSLFGNGCSSAPPPPTALSEGAKWCEPHGGMQGILSKTNGPDDYLLTCNDGSHCTRKPGQTPKCATAAELAANRKQKIALASIEFSTKLPKWESDFRKRWLPKCLDAPCEGGIKLVTLAASAAVSQAHDKSPESDFLTISYVRLGQAEKDAAATIEEYRFKLLPGRWGPEFEARWLPRCRTIECRLAIQQVWRPVIKNVAALGAIRPQRSYSQATPLFVAAEQKAAGLIADSIRATETRAPIGDVGRTSKPQGNLPNTAIPSDPRYAPSEQKGGRPDKPIVPATPKGNLTTGTVDAGKPSGATKPVGNAGTPVTNKPLSNAPPSAVAPVVPRGVLRTVPKPSPSATPTGAPTPSSRMR